MNATVLSKLRMPELPDIATILDNSLLLTQSSVHDFHDLALRILNRFAATFVKGYNFQFIFLEAIPPF